jgi:hypothetical protein
MQHIPLLQDLRFFSKSLKTVFSRYVVAGTLLNNYAHIFDLLTRLRQVNSLIKIGYGYTS